MRFGEVLVLRSDCASLGCGGTIFGWFAAGLIATDISRDLVADLPLLALLVSL